MATEAELLHVRAGHISENIVTQGGVFFLERGSICTYTKTQNRC